MSELDRYAPSMTLMKMVQLQCVNWLRAAGSLYNLHEMTLHFLISYGNFFAFVKATSC